jgi:hypothetical protein
MFLANDMVPITGTMTAPGEMHGYEITLRNKADNAVLYTTSGHAHGTSITLQQQWKNNVSSDTEVELEVVAILDHAGNKTVKKVAIHCHSQPSGPVLRAACQQPGFGKTITCLHTKSLLFWSRLFSGLLFYWLLLGQAAPVIFQE